LDILLYIKKPPRLPSADRPACGMQAWLRQPSVAKPHPFTRKIYFPDFSLLVSKVPFWFWLWEDCYVISA